MPPGAPIGDPDAAWLDMFGPPCSLWDVAAGGPAVDLGSTVPNAASRANAISATMFEVTVRTR